MSFHIQSTKEHLENTGGIVLAAELARISGLTNLNFPVRTWSGALLKVSYRSVGRMREGRATLKFYGIP